VGGIGVIGYLLFAIPLYSTHYKANGLSVIFENGACSLYELVYVNLSSVLPVGV
jgi:hypothetical protein